nr:hypothetical protein Iba_chr02fCG12480 [Ipomoea batatas]
MQIATLYANDKVSNVAYVEHLKEKQKDKSLAIGHVPHTFKIASLNANNKVSTMAYVVHLKLVLYKLAVVIIKLVCHPCDARNEI